jgi:hypothetical protein
MIKKKCIIKCGGDAKISNIKRAIKKNTHVEMDGVSATDKTSTTKGRNEDYAQCRTNTRETVTWLQKGEATRFAHLPLLSLSLWLQACGLLWICGLWRAHTHYVFLLFVSLFFAFVCLGVALVSCSWSTSKLGSARYKHTLSQFGVKCMMLRNSRKATLKG